MIKQKITSEEIYFFKLWIMGKVGKLQETVINERFLLWWLGDKCERSNLIREFCIEFKSQHRFYILCAGLLNGGRKIDIA